MVGTKQMKNLPGRFFVVDYLGQNENNIKLTVYALSRNNLQFNSYLNLSLKLSSIVLNILYLLLGYHDPILEWS